MRKCEIGDIKLSSPFLMAPLAGITDAPMRRICHEMGAAMTYTEMVSAKGLTYGDRNTKHLLDVYEDEGPVSVQLFGCEPEIFVKAALEYCNKDFAMVDINMGCPVHKVVRNGEGSALLKNPERAGEIVEALVKALDRPVTAKIRKGFDDTCINGVEMAKVLEQAGVAAVAVHGRTREQFYEGKADWDIIREIKNAVSIPVIGNGDIFSAEDAIRMMDETGCDLVMIARGALGNPWIFRDCLALWEGREKPAPPTREDKQNMVLRHFEDLLELKGEYAGVREMRKHIGWYIKGLPGAAAFRREINQITDAEILKTRIKEI